MNKRTLTIAAAMAGLLMAAACSRKDNNATDTAGTAAMTDTGMGATGTMGTPPTTGTMGDTTATGTADTTGTGAYSSGRTSGDTTTKR